MTTILRVLWTLLLTVGIFCFAAIVRGSFKWIGGQIGGMIADGGVLWSGISFGFVLAACWRSTKHESPRI